MMAIVKSVGPYLLIGFGVAGVSFLSTKSNREKVICSYKDVKQKALKFWYRHRPEVLYEDIEKAGHPDPYDFGDNQMVDEGAMFSVNYYNDKVHS